MTSLIDTFLNKTLGSLINLSPNSRTKKQPNKLAHYAVLKSYQSIFERNKLKRPISTKNIIGLSNKLSFGSSTQEAKNAFTQPPVEALFNTQKINRHILLFKETENGNQVDIEMHFHQNKLFFFRFLFPKANAALRTSLMKGILEKYNLPNIDLTLHSIYDTDNNCIHIRDLNTFEVLYTSLESPFFNKVVKEISKTNNQLLVDYHLTSAPTILT